VVFVTVTGSPGKTGDGSRVRAATGGTSRQSISILCATELRENSSQAASWVRTASWFDDQGYWFHG